MNKIIKYILVTEETPREVAERVNLRIADGYQPFGNLIVNERYGYYTQPMVKYESLSG